MKRKFKLVAFADDSEQQTKGIFDSLNQVDHVQLDENMFNSKHGLMYGLFGGVNEVELAGRLTKNPRQVKNTRTNHEFVTTQIAASYRYTDGTGKVKTKTNYVPLRFYYNTDAIQSACSGDEVFLKGNLTTFTVQDPQNENGAVLSLYVMVTSYIVDHSSETRKQFRKTFEPDEKKTPATPDKDALYQ